MTTQSIEGAMPPLPDLPTLADLAQKYAIHFASPHHFVMSVYTLRFLLIDIGVDHAPLLARVAELQAALHEAGDLAASSRSGPAQAESLRLIEEIAVKASEHRDGRLAALERAGKAEAENAALRAELQNIADAKPSSWDAEVRDQFMPWAQNRARAALAAHKEQP